MSEIATPESTPEASAPEVEASKAETDWKAEAKKWESRSKENFENLKAAQEAAAKWAQHEEAQKSEAQKTAERLAQTEAEAKAARAELIRYKVAAAKGLTPELVTRLKGETEEELAADADELLKLIGSTKAKPVQPVKSQGVPATAGPLSARQAFIEALNN